MGSKITIFEPMKQGYIFVLISLVFLFYGCIENPKRPELKEGDLLFQDLDCGSMCDAIETVTEGVNGMDFSHCAMVIRNNDSLKVIEAIGEGVVITPLKEFIKRSSKIQAARLKGRDEALLKRACRYAKALKGKAYDEVFLLNNDQYYCSELLYEAFKSANYGKEVFGLEPMTFKDPSTHEFYPVWVDYYKQFKCPIPEGKPGLNPGSISRSKRLKLVKFKWIP